MSILAVLLALLVGGALQAMLPAFAWLGSAAVPILPSLVIYYALTRHRAAVLGIAVTAGVIQDALGLVPLGYSSCALCVAGLALHRYRDEVFTHAALTHAVFGLVAVPATVGILATLLAAGTHYWPGAVVVLGRMAGAALLGAVCAPPVCAAAARVDAALGLSSVEGRV